jgi:hypothetical protein
VNSWVFCTKTPSVVVSLLIVFLVEVSLEFPIEIFLATCGRETLINEWLIPWVRLDKQMDGTSFRLLDLLHTHLGFLFPNIFLYLLVIISHYPVSYILGRIFTYSLQFSL